MDKSLDGLKTTKAHLDDLIILSKGTLDQHEKEMDKTLKTLDNENWLSFYTNVNLDLQKLYG